MNKYDTFEDIEQLLSGIVTILQDPPDFFDEDMVQEFSDLMGFCEEVLEDRDLKLAGGSASKESKDLGKDLGALIGKSNININILEGIKNEKDIDLIIESRS